MRRWKVISTGDTGGGLVATQWVMRGTNTGPLPDGTPATGRTITHFLEPSLREIRFAWNGSILTGGICLSNWGSKESKQRFTEQVTEHIAPAAGTMEMDPAFACDSAICGFARSLPLSNTNCYVRNCSILFT